MALNSIIYIKGTNTLKTKWLRLTQEEIDSLYYHVSIKEIEIRANILPTRKTSGLSGFPGEFCHIREWIPIQYNLF